MKTLNRSAFLTLAFSLLAPGAFAGPPAPSPRPVLVPWSLSAEQDGSESVFNHGAGLGFMEGSEVGLGFSLLTEGNGHGNGLFATAGTGVGPLRFGLGLARLSEQWGDGESVIRADLGMAVSMGGNASLGLGWHGLYSDVLPQLDAYESWSLSATVRPLRVLAVAMDIDRLNTPVLGDVSLPVNGRLGLAFRPGTERVTLGVDGSVEFRADGKWSVGASFRTMLMDGLVLGAYGRYADSPEGAPSVQWGATLSIAQSGMDLSTGVIAAKGLEGAPNGSAVSTMLTYSGAGSPSLVSPSSLIRSFDISGSIPEQSRRSFFGRERPAWAYWLAALDAITRDESVAGIVLNIRRAPNWTQCWELRQAVRRLVQAGKRVYARIGVADMRAMYLAAAADRIYIDPSGTLMLTGLSITKSYFGETLNRVGIKAQFLRFEDHKSFPERFTRQGPSGPAKEQTRALLDHFQRAWLEAVSEGRKVDQKRLRELLAQGPLTVDMALAGGLVDAAAAEDAVEKLIEADIGHGVTIHKGYQPDPSAWPQWGNRPKIAVVPVLGSIAGGKSRRNMPLLGGIATGSATFAKTLKRIEKDASFAGAVIRVDSPGGGILASDRMHRAVTSLAAKKPVVISFGNVAASGGYYLSVAAPWIMASPMTITGSVGVFAGKVDLSGLFSKLGITTDTTNSQDGADVMGFHRSWTEAEMVRLKKRLGVYYERFLRLVSKGRSLSMKQTRERAGGRVYDGDRALKLKLVDAHGSLWDAIQRVREEAKLTNGFELAYLPEGSGIGGLLNDLGLRTVAEDEVWTDSASLISRLSSLFADLLAPSESGVLARLPFEVSIQ